MTQYTVADAKPANRLREAYGDDVVLSEDGQEGAAVHKIVLEFDLGEQSYVVLKPEDESEDEASVFRVVPSADGEFDIETIEDDEEWENVSELVDEMTVAFPNE
ncbi:DUF1292 domain-containing protein [Paenibacillus sp. TRM 82003]|nr:DUF1292 domain-containing protein [Paenibacillus sp. TRM 82003]